LLLGKTPELSGGAVAAKELEALAINFLVKGWELAEGVDEPA